MVRAVPVLQALSEVQRGLTDDEPDAQPTEKEPLYPSAWQPVASSDPGSYYDSESDGEYTVVLLANETGRGASYTDSYIEILKFPYYLDANDILICSEQHFRDNFGHRDEMITSFANTELAGVPVRTVTHTQENAYYQSYFYAVGHPCTGLISYAVKKR